MPCYSIQTTKVAMGKVDLERMARAAQSSGWTAAKTETRLVLTKGAVRATFEKGSEEVQLRGGTVDTAAVLKRAYAAQTVADAARKHGWKVNSQTTEGNTIKLKIGR